MTDLTYEQTLHLHLTGLTVDLMKTYGQFPDNAMAGVAKTVYAALRDAAGPTPEPVVGIDKPTKAQIKASITDDALISFEDGKPYKMLKRSLSLRGMTMAYYREKWGLPDDYPSVAPAYSARRSELAKANGLGRKR